MATTGLSSRRRNEDSIKTWDERAKTFNEHEMCQRKALLQAQTQERLVQWQKGEKNEI